MSVGRVFSGDAISETVIAAQETAVAPWLRAGGVRLVFARAPGGKTLITRAQAASPVRLLTPENSGRGAWAYVSTFGGGLLGGDSTEIDVEVGPAATAYLSTQSATKVFRSRDDRHTQQQLAARVADEGLLILLPDPVSCFAGARYRQSQRIDLAPMGSLVMLDWITSGRHARGERWAATECLTANEIFIAGQCLLRDRILMPRGVQGLGMNHFNCLGTLVLAGPRCAAGGAAIHAALAEAPVQPGGPVQWGVSPLGDRAREGAGLMLRIAGPDVESVAGTIFPLLSFVSEALGEAPWQRKW